MKQLGFVTVRKRSLRRLCFYTCLSFCSQGGGGSASVHAWIPPPSPRTRHTPPEQTPPPRDQAPPPRSRHPHRTRPSLPYCYCHVTATAADGTHPTGMYSCLNVDSEKRHRIQMVHRESNLMFTLSSDKDKKSLWLWFWLLVNEPLQYNKVFLNKCVSK